MFTPALTYPSRRGAAAHPCCLEMDCLMLSMNVGKRGGEPRLWLFREIWGEGSCSVANEMIRRSLQQQCRRD